ncbi:hypothetical protein FNH09_21015 [Streptomyces adustus]|uniref:Uncharacterized protein n=1 Tax=Streptomyces adustus TaxID=1609272 RepID=A0A5N8VEH3_9ACTN|nr:hypothetical protein [Streptomyces adustus]MPY33637.1 hypothetical protein [Streptomyces adustus]
MAIKDLTCGNAQALALGLEHGAKREETPELSAPRLLLQVKGGPRRTSTRLGLEAFQEDRALP